MNIGLTSSRAARDVRWRIRQRRGLSLVELLVVMAIMSLLVALCSHVLLSLYRIRKSSIEAQYDAIAWQRLTQQIRQDAHAARNARTADTDLVLQHSPREIRYQPTEQTVRRVVIQEGSIVQREEWRFPAGETVRIQLQGEDGLWVWVERIGPAGNGQPPLATRVGIDYRFQPLESTEAEPLPDNSQDSTPANKPAREDAT